MPSFLKVWDNVLGSENGESVVSADMIADSQKQGKDRIDPAAEDFMPYSCTVLNRSLIEYATKHLNETEETKEKALKDIREFLKKEMNIHDAEDIYILCYLRSRKFDLKRTINSLRNLAEFADSYKLDRTNMESVRLAIQSNVIGFLPYRDAKNRAMVFLKSEYWDPNKIKADDIIFGSIAALHIATENPVNQVAGFVVILDFKNLRVQQIIAMSSWLIFGIQALQKCCPCLVKEFHVLHTPSIFRIAWKMVQPLLSDKIKKRIIFYKSAHWQSLHRRIPPAILPEELGGQLGPFSNEHWAGDISYIEHAYKRKVRKFMYTRDKNKP